MLIRPCAPPIEPVEPAPLTDLALHIGSDSVALTAFWGGEDAYYVRADALGGDQSWYRIEAPATEETTLTEEARVAIGAMMASVLPLGAGRVAFPTGSSGRVVYRIWRSRGAGAESRTRIRGVRAARSRRLPA